MNRIIFVLILFSTLSGCMTTKFTKEGRTIRTISPVVAQNCKHIGIANSWKPSLEGGLSAAQIDIRNKVAALGGNAMIIASQQVDPPPYQHAEILAEAYNCNF